MLSLVENLFPKKNPVQDLLSGLNAVISTNESTWIITGHVINNPAYTYKFQLKTTYTCFYCLEMIILQFIQIGLIANYKYSHFIDSPNEIVEKIRIFSTVQFNRFAMGEELCQSLGCVGYRLFIFILIFCSYSRFSLVGNSKRTNTFFSCFAYSRISCIRSAAINLKKTRSVCRWSTPTLLRRFFNKISVWPWLEST